MLTYPFADVRNSAAKASKSLLNQTPLAKSLVARVANNKATMLIRSRFNSECSVQQCLNDIADKRVPYSIKRNVLLSANIFCIAHCPIWFIVKLLFAFPWINLLPYQYWFWLLSLLHHFFVLQIPADLGQSLRRGNLLIPQTYSPINGDLNVQLQYFSQVKPKSTYSDGSALSSEEDDFVKTTSAPKLSPDDDVRLQVSRYNGTNRTTVAILDVYPDARLNITQITISCLNFQFGGIYELEIVGGNEIDDVANNHDERLRQQLDVRWPQPKLSVTPESIGTYPQQPVDVILEFPGVECVVPQTQIDSVPEFWLELYFCGHEVYCDSANVSSSQVLFAEQIRGYPKARLVKLSCELFGLAGHYVVKLRPTGAVAASVSATAYIQVNHIAYLKSASVLFVSPFFAEYSKAI